MTAGTQEVNGRLTDEKSEGTRSDKVMMRVVSKRQAGDTTTTTLSVTPKRRPIGWTAKSKTERSDRAFELHPGVSKAKCHSNLSA